MSWKKRIVQVVTILLSLWLIANIDTDTWIGLICGPIIVYIIYCIVRGKFEIVSGSGNRQDVRSSYYHNRPKTGITHPCSWQNDKTWVPGHGYRDTYGNYYDYKGMPTITPVNTGDK